MKIRNLLSISLLLFSLNSFSQTIDEELPFWINSGDFLQLNKRYQEEKNNIQHETVKLLAEAYINTAFNKPEEALRVANLLVTYHQESLGLNGITACIFLIAENLRYQGKYLSAADMVISYIKQTDTFNGVDENTRNILLSQSSLAAFGDFMKPEIQRPAKNTVVPFVENDNLIKDAIYINATINGKEVPFGFDTGADGYATNMVTEKFARENGIEILNDSVVVYGIREGMVKLGRAESMTIGDITYKNVAFMIAPGDNILPIDTLHLDAVLGSVFMKAVGEFQIYPKEKKIVFPLRQTELPATGRNLMFRGGQPYVEAFTGEERLILHFDTGGGINLSDKYFNEHQEEIEATGVLEVGGGVGGFGGVKYINKYTIKDFPLRITGNGNITIPEVDVFTGEGLAVDQFDGSLGSDFVNMFNKVTVNFDKMFILLE